MIHGTNLLVRSRFLPKVLRNFQLPETQKIILSEMRFNPCKVRLNIKKTWKRILIIASCEMHLAWVKFAIMHGLNLILHECIRVQQPQNDNFMRSQELLSNQMTL